MIFTAADSVEMIAAFHDSDVTWNTIWQEQLNGTYQKVRPQGEKWPESPFYRIVEWDEHQLA